MDCSLPGSSVRGIFQARALEWGAIAFSNNNRSTHLFCQVLFWVIYMYYFLQSSQEPYEEGNMFSPFYRWGNWGRGKLSNFLKVMKLVTGKDELHPDNASLNQCCLNSSVMQPLGLNAAPYEWGKHQFLWGVSVCDKLLHLRLTFCNPMDHSPPGSSVYGILQARILEWVAMPSYRRFSQPRYQTHISYVSCIGRQVLYH